MKTKKYLKSSILCLFAIAVILNGIFLQGNTRENDIILDYCFQKLSALETNNINKDNYLQSLAKFYVMKGNIEKTFRLLEMFSAEGEYGQYSVLLELLNHSRQLSQSQFKKVLEFIPRVNENSLIASLFHHLTITYLNNNDKKNALLVLENLKKINTEDESFVFDLLLFLASPLSHAGLEKEAIQLLEQYEHFAFAGE